MGFCCICAEERDFLRDIIFRLFFFHAVAWDWEWIHFWKGGIYGHKVGNVSTSASSAIDLCHTVIDLAGGRCLPAKGHWLPILVPRGYRAYLCRNHVPGHHDQLAQHEPALLYNSQNESWQPGWSFAYLCACMILKWAYLPVGSDTLPHIPSASLRVCL